MYSFNIIWCFFISIFVSSFALNKTDQHKDTDIAYRENRYSNNTNHQKTNDSRRYNYEHAGPLNYPKSKNGMNPADAYSYRNRQKVKNFAGRYNNASRHNPNNGAGQYYNNPRSQNAMNPAGGYNYRNRQNPNNAAGPYKNYQNRQAQMNAAGGFNYPNRQHPNNAAGANNNIRNRQHEYNAGGTYNNYPNRQNMNNMGNYQNGQNEMNPADAYNYPKIQDARITAGIRDQNADSDIPKKTDLEQYVLALDKLLQYFMRDPNYVDVNIVFGFFLLKVNMWSALDKKQSPQGNITGLPVMLSEKVTNITKMNEKILRYFRMMAAHVQDPVAYHKQLRKIATLFSNEAQWAALLKPADKMEVVEPPSMSYNDIVYRFSSWPEYKSQIGNQARIMPSFDLTEKCLIVLSENKVHRLINSSWPKCNWLPECYTGLAAGNEIGFGMTNRLMMLTQARFGRRCSIFGKEEDRQVIDKLCSTIYYETSFIGMNKYDPLILVLEQISLCSLNGHVEFLRRPWLNYLLALQTPFGCFADVIMSSSQRRSMRPNRPVGQWKIDRGNDRAQGGQTCVGTTSAAAATILGAAIKYTMDLYY